MLSSLLAFLISFASLPLHQRNKSKHIEQLFRNRDWTTLQEFLPSFGVQALKQEQVLSKACLYQAPPEIIRIFIENYGLDINETSGYVS